MNTIGTQSVGTGFSASKNDRRAPFGGLSPARSAPSPNPPETVQDADVPEDPEHEATVEAGNENEETAK